MEKIKLNNTVIDCSFASYDLMAALENSPVRKVHLDLIVDDFKILGEEIIINGAKVTNIALDF